MAPLQNATLSQVFCGEKLFICLPGTYFSLTLVTSLSFLLKNYSLLSSIKIPLLATGMSKLGQSKSLISGHCNWCKA